MKHRHEEIAARAYKIWEREGRPANKADEHWLRAERELCGERSAPASGYGEMSGPGESEVSVAGSQTPRPVTPGGGPSDGADGCCGGRKMRGSHRHAGGRQGGRGDSKPSC